MSSIYEKIISYLLENPGAKPRQIADSIGESLSRVRRALYVLRDRGVIARSGQGYVVVRSRLRPPQKSTQTTETSNISSKTPMKSEEVYGEKNNKNIDGLDVNSKWLSEIITNILKNVNDLSKRIEKLEKEVSVIKAQLDSLKKKQDRDIDRFISLVKREKIMIIEEAKRYMQKSLDYYIINGYIIVVDNIVVEREYYDNFKRKFPLRISDVKKLNEKEILLLKKLVEEGTVYLHGGNEYRFVE